MKQEQGIIFLIKAEEIYGVLQGNAVLIRPTNGIPPFFIMLDPAIRAALNGHVRLPGALTPVPAPKLKEDKGYTVHRRPPGPGKGRFECKCGTTFKKMGKLWLHQKEAHAQS